MNLSSLQTLTWGTVGAAIVSALTLAAIEPAGQSLSRSVAARPELSQPLPAEPTAAGPQPQAAASAPVEATSQRAAPATL